MKNVSIITINGFTNYGNRLQNLALSRLLEEKHFKVINGLSYYTKEEWIRSSKSLLKKILKFFIPFFIFKRNYSRYYYDSSRISKKRHEAFVKYYSKYYSSENIIIGRTTKSVKKKLNKLQIDYFVVGSDQVWNPFYECFDYELLTAVPNEKKFSFAASFGVSQVDKASRKKLCSYLSSFMYLSVREQSAVEIVYSITGRKADLTFDPTLLLSAEEWSHYIQEARNKEPRKYICTYFLGETPDVVKKYADEKQLSIVSINDKNAPELYDINPGEFLYFIKNAEYVFTDSFHAVAFSIKFHKNFCVFHRNQYDAANMFTRIESIINLLQLNNHIYSEDYNFDFVEKEETWKRIDVILSEARNNALNKLIDSGMKP